MRGAPSAVAQLLVLLLFLAGCGKSGPAAGQAGELRIGYFANLTHAQAVLEVDSGDLAAAVAPWTLKTHVFNAGPSLIEGLNAGEVDIGYVGPGPVLNADAVSDGQAVRIIAGAAANGVVIVVRPGAGIHALPDLASKRIATPQHGNTQDISARHYVTAVLHQNSTDNVIAIANAEQAAMMSRGECDAAWVPEPWGTVLEKQLGAHILAEEKDLWPSGQFSLTLVVTTPQFLAAHPDVVEAVLKVHRRWTRRLQTSSQQYTGQLSTALAKLTGKTLGPDILTEAMGRVRFTDEPLEDTLKTMAQWSYDLKIGRQPTPSAGLVDLNILRRLQQQPDP